MKRTSPNLYQWLTRHQLGLRITMSAATGSFVQSIEDREFAYLLSGMRLRANQTIPRLDIGSIHLEGVNQGDVLEVPRWIAEVLTKLGVCESQEESFSQEVFKAVNREKMAGENQLAALRSDFYLKVR